MWLFVISCSILMSARVQIERLATKYPFGIMLFKLAWFVFISIYEYNSCKGYNWWPKYLGGEGDIASLFETTENSSILHLYELQFAYHLHSTIHAALYGAKLEMHVHHYVTLALIIASYYYGYMRIGVVVTLLHDVPDISTTMIKLSMSINNIYATLFSLACLLSSWAFFRIYLLSKLILSIIDAHDYVSLQRRVSFSFLLGTLFLLHCFWYSMFLKMVYNYKTKGKTKDISEADPNDRYTITSKGKPVKSQ
eukprot:m.76499 g.76499  ORF g.76499 m.76499 type:complete len:252 (-) comp11884_c3_seq1:138-893(-)